MNRPIEVARLHEDRSWDTELVEIPANTLPSSVEFIAIEEATRRFGRSYLYTVYNTMEDEIPEPSRGTIVVELSFDKGEITVGPESEQCLAAVDMVNLQLSRQPYGLGARLEICMP